LFLYSQKIAVLFILAKAARLTKPQ